MLVPTNRPYAELLITLRQEIDDYLASGSEADLEAVETRLALALIDTGSNYALAVWDHVQQNQARFLEGAGVELED